MYIYVEASRVHQFNEVIDKNTLNIDNNVVSVAGETEFAGYIT